MLGGMAPSLANPVNDQKSLIATYRERFPNVTIDQYVHGVYAIDAQLRKQYEAINEFPPYAFDVDEGEHLFKRSDFADQDIAGCLKTN